jgi:hypothetical protein
VIANSNRAKPKKPVPKTTAAPKADTAKPKKSAAASVKAVAARHTTNHLVVTTYPTNSPLEVISDLIDNLPLEALVELNLRLLTSISSLPTGVARPRAVVKPVILIVAEYGSTP